MYELVLTCMLLAAPSKARQSYAFDRYRGTRKKLGYPGACTSITLAHQPPAHRHILQSIMLKRPEPHSVVACTPVGSSYLSAEKTWGDLYLVEESQDRQSYYIASGMISL
jgi:hypothetical protein